MNPSSDFSVKLDWNESKKHIDDILALPERIAKDKKIKIILCIDEFQQIAEFNNSELIQQKLRSVWQHHTKVNYCLYGSKRHIINAMFTKTSMPFFKFGDLVHLNKIAPKHWEKFIQQAFVKNKKEIELKYIKIIISTVNNHPYFVQQLAHQVYINTSKRVDNKTLKLAIDELLLYNQTMYMRDIESLSILQLALLKAIANKETKITSKEVINKYHLGTTGNILRLKNALEQKEIIDFYETTPSFIDPLFEVWFNQFVNK